MADGCWRSYVVRPCKLNRYWYGKKLQSKLTKKQLKQALKGKDSRKTLTQEILRKHKTSKQEKLLQVLLKEVQLYEGVFSG